MDAVNNPEEKYVVGLVNPLKLTTASELKFAPYTVSVNPLLPSTLPSGDICVTTGSPALLTTENATAFDTPPPGIWLYTVMLWFPTDAISFAVIDAVS